MEFSTPFLSKVAYTLFMSLLYFFSWFHHTLSVNTSNFVTELGVQWQGQHTVQLILCQELTQVLLDVLTD